MRLRHFAYDEEMFGNIVAEYANDSSKIQIVRDRGLVETAIASVGGHWRTLDSLLQEIGAPPSAQVVYQDEYDCFGKFNGCTAVAQSSTLRAHLPAIIRHITGA